MAYWTASVTSETLHHLTFTPHLQYSGLWGWQESAPLRMAAWTWVTREGWAERGSHIEKDPKEDVIYLQHQGCDLWHSAKLTLGTARLHKCYLVSVREKPTAILLVSTISRCLQFTYSEGLHKNPSEDCSKTQTHFFYYYCYKSINRAIKTFLQVATVSQYSTDFEYDSVSLHWHFQIPKKNIFLYSLWIKLNMTPSCHPTRLLRCLVSVVKWCVLSPRPH